MSERASDQGTIGLVSVDFASPIMRVPRSKSADFVLDAVPRSKSVDFALLKGAGPKNGQPRLKVWIF